MWPGNWPEKMNLETFVKYMDKKDDDNDDNDKPTPKKIFEYCNKKHNDDNDHTKLSRTEARNCWLEEE
jgi:hypothetical protein